MKIIKMWHWRDVLCWMKLKFSKNGYSVREFCGTCNKCNRLFGYCGVIPCPARFGKPTPSQGAIAKDVEIGTEGGRHD